MKKRKIVLNDKAKISAVIAELDQKKNEALKKAWEQVNKVQYETVLSVSLFNNTKDYRIHWSISFVKNFTKFQCIMLPLFTLDDSIFQDFGSIYSTLLPGATAKLAPPEGQSVLDGLEVKVGFGDVWKDSLSELSGGQRLVSSAVKDILYIMK